MDGSSGIQERCNSFCTLRFGLECSLKVVYGSVNNSSPQESGKIDQLLAVSVFVPEQVRLAPKLAHS